jgi:uridine kinase
MPPKPHIIGIAGGSCSGKTTLAASIAGTLSAGSPGVPPSRVSVYVALDSYYRDLSGRSPSEIEHYNFDHPDAVELPLLVEHLRALAGNETIQKPVYDYTTHSRRGAEALTPAPVIIIEGLFTLYWREVRDLLGTGVFIDASHDTCLSRRIQRDTRERGRTPAEVRRRYRDQVQPMFDRYVLPTRRHADVVVNGEEPFDAAVSVIVRRVGESKSQ